MIDPKLKEKFPQPGKFDVPPIRPVISDKINLDALQLSLSKDSSDYTPGENYARILRALVRASFSKVVLEIGAGGSSIAFAQALKEVSKEDSKSFPKNPELFSIEINNDIPAPSTIMDVLELYAVSWSVVHGDSLKVPLSSLPPSVDLLYIDGDHGGEHSIGDYQRYAPLVRVGGLIVFDDYPLFPGPVAAVSTLAAEGVNGIIIVHNLQDGNGFYVIRK